MEHKPVGREQQGERSMLAAGALLIVAVAIVDLAAGRNVVVIGYLVLGPLIAATRARPRLVAGLVALAIAIAIPLGSANDVFLELRHLIPFGLIIAGGTIAVLLAGALGDLRTTRTREAIAHQRLSLLDRSSRLIAAPLNAATRLEELTRLPIPDLAPLCVVDLLADDGGISSVVVSAAAEAHADAIRDVRERFPLDPNGPHPVAVALRTGVPQLIGTLDDEALRSYTTDPQHAELIRRMQYGSAVIAPLVAHGHPVGVMSLVRFRDQRSFDEADFAVVTDLAARASVAIDNARLFDELRDAENQLDAILSVIAEAVTVQNREGRLIYVNDAARRLLAQPDHGDVLEQDPAAILARYAMFDELGEPLDPARLPGRAALRGEVPEPLSVRWLDRATGVERWTTIKASAVCDKNGTPTLAVNIIEDVTEDRRRSERTAVLAEASSLLTQNTEFEINLATLAEALVRRVGEACEIALVDESGELATVASAPTGGSREQRPPELDRAWATGQPILREDGTAAVAPLVAGDRTIGVLRLAVHSDSIRRFDDADIELVQELARRIGLAVEHARVHRERTHIALTLQRSLLPPRLPEIHGMSIAARFRAAGSGNQVGGDFYDVFDVDGAWIVVIGDVTGKGPDAAAITSLARYTIRTAARYERSPSDILERLNEALLREAGEHRRLCTAICVRIENDGRVQPVRITLASAGHPPPYLLSGDSVRTLATSGPLLGAFEDASWQLSKVELTTGDSLVLYTDGVTDAHGPGDERFGEVRLRSTLSSAIGAGADGVAAAVDAALAAFEAGPQRDDVALLVVSAQSGGDNDVEERSAPRQTVPAST